MDRADGSARPRRTGDDCTHRHHASRNCPARHSRPAHRHRRLILPSSSSDKYDVPFRTTHGTPSSAKTAPQTRKKNTQTAPQRRKRTAPRHQKYIITGTRDTYVVSQGETLRTIAEHVYGSRGYARYIIEHNHITHPDDIPVGLTIRLPELELNPDYRP